MGTIIQANKIPNKCVYKLIHSFVANSIRLLLRFRHFSFDLRAKGEQ